MKTSSLESKTTEGALWRLFKQWAQGFLRRVGLYERLKWSFFYDLYWAVANRQRLEKRAKEVEFYKETLIGFQQGDIIFDVGAHRGLKTNIFLRLGARVVAVEPDLRNQEILRQRFLKYRLLQKPVRIESKAVSDNISVAKLWINASDASKNTLNRKWVDIVTNETQCFDRPSDFNTARDVETITLDKLIAVHGLPFFIKIDVEGHEVNALRGLTRSVPYLSFEVNLPQFKAEGLHCVNILNRIDPNGQFNYIVESKWNLMSERWMCREECAHALSCCRGHSVEIFWRTRIIS